MGEEKYRSPKRVERPTLEKNFPQSTISGKDRGISGGHEAKGRTPVPKWRVVQKRGRKDLLHSEPGGNLRGVGGLTS